MNYRSTGTISTLEIWKNALKQIILNKVEIRFFAKRRNNLLLFYSIDSVAEAKATSKNVDDCSNATLEVYPPYRRLFCINHVTGEIYTTHYYTQDTLLSGTRFHLNIVLGSTNQFIKFPPDNPFSIEIISKCHNLSSAYLILNNARCRAGLISASLTSKSGIDDSLTDRFTVKVESSEAKFNDFYFNHMVIDFSSVEENLAFTKQIQKGDSFNVIVSYIREDLEQRKEARGFFVGFTKQIVYIDHPIEVQNGETLAFAFTMQNDTFVQFFRIPTSGFSVNLLSKFSICWQDADDDCFKWTTIYKEQLQKVETECENIDNFSFYGRYGYCQGKYNFLDFILYNCL